MGRCSAWIGLVAACLAGSGAIAAESSDPHTRSWTSLQDMHADYVKAFVQSDGFGIRRITPMMLLLQGGSITLEGQRLRVEDVQLIGIARHDPPVVYPGGFLKFQHGDAEQEFLTRVATRVVDEREQGILAKLRAGEEVVSQVQAGGIATVGAIRASEACLQCHRNKQVGDLLGAFVYRLAPAQHQAGSL